MQWAPGLQGSLGSLDSTASLEYWSALADRFHDNALKNFAELHLFPVKCTVIMRNLINKSVNELARRCRTSNISWINKLYPNKFFLDDKYMKSYNFKQAGPIKSFTDISWQPCLLFLVKVIPIYIKNNKNVKQIVITKHNAYWCPFRFILLKL